MIFSMIIFVILLVLATQLAPSSSECALTPDASGHVDIPNSWTSIPKYAFYQCAKLKSVIIGENVTRIESTAFAESSLESVVFAQDSLTYIANNAFAGTTKLKTLNLPNGVTGIGPFAFALSGITTLVIPGSLKNISSTYFASCTSLKSVILKAGVERISNFNGCLSLESLVIPSTVQYIAEDAFKKVTSLKTLSLGGDSITQGKNAFSNAFDDSSSGELWPQLILTGTITGAPGRLSLEMLTEDCKFRYIKITDAVDTIAAGAFKSCDKIVTLEVELSSKSQALDLGALAFSRDSCQFQNISIGRRNVKVHGDSFHFACMTNLETLQFVKNISIEGVDIPTGELLMKDLICNNAGCGCKPGWGSSLTDSPLYFGNCKGCGVGKYSNLNDNREVCLACPNNTFNAVIASTECKACNNLVPDGNGRNVCGDKCPKGTHVIDSGTSCSKCKPGKYSDQEGMEACDDCPTGRYSNTEAGASLESCILCSAGRFASEVGLSICEKCPEGKSSSAQGSYECTSCLPAHYTSIKGLKSCMPCPAGKYNQESGKTACEECEGNLTSLPGEAKINDDCFYPCPRGSASFGSQKSCKECYPGTYNNVTNQAVCAQCPLGRYSNLANASECSVCDRGSFASANGSPYCTLCDAGKFGTILGSKGEKDCRLCDLGYFSFPGSTTCREAPPGSFINTTGAADSTKCRAGRYQPYPAKTECIEAPSGKYAEKGAAVALLCAAGTYNDQAGGTSKESCKNCPIGKSDSLERKYCSPCDKGKYSNAVGAPDCDPCEAGKAVNETGAKECLKCPPGKFTAEKGRVMCLTCRVGEIQRNPGSQKCEPCGYGLTSNPTHTECIEDTTPKCKAGFGMSGSTGKCVACEPGSYSPNGMKCITCKAAHFSDKKESSECQPCPPGRFGIAIGGDSEEGACSNCSIGRYVNIFAATECFECTPGSSCPNEGMSSSEECVLGKYTDTKMSKHCIDCPPGRYQNVTGSAKCFFCDMGTYFNGTGATNRDQCLPCEPGSYGANTGLAVCSSCATGQVQPDTGASNCDDCSMEKFETNNPEHTRCIVNKALVSTSLVEAMFDKGIALALAFTVSGSFTFLSLTVHFMKGKFNTEGISSLGVHQVILKSALPGFSFGSEMFLIIGMMTDARGIAGTMLTFRLLHPIAMIFFSVVLFYPSILSKDIHNFMDISSGLHVGFVKRIIPLLGLLTLSCFGDITMIQMLPWKASEFYSESNGFPSYNMMRVTLGVKTLQAVVSVICQIIYLSVNNSVDNPTTSPQAKALFGLNITISMASLFMGILILALKGKYLKDKDSKKGRSDNNGDSIDVMDIADFYGTEGEEGVEGSSEAPNTITPENNPLHSPAAVNALRRESEAQKNEILQKDLEIIDKEVQLEKQAEEIKRLTRELENMRQLEMTESRNL